MLFGKEKGLGDQFGSAGGKEELKKGWVVAEKVAEKVEVERD